MNEGDIILTPVPQADGQIKNRPALLLRIMPPYGDALVCGISTQLRRAVVGFDETITGQDDDFTDSGLIADSLVRLGFLALVPQRKLVGSIGSVAPERHARLLQKLAAYLLQPTQPEK